MRPADIAIIGGGINGVTLAWKLARRGAQRVVLLERDHLASGPTGRSGAVIRCHYSTPDLVRLAIEGRSFYRNASDLVGDDCGFRQVGFLATVPPDGVAALEAKVAMQRAAGLEDVEVLRGAQIRAVEPELTLEDVGAAAYEPLSGHAQPVQATRAIARRAAALGVEIHEQTVVREVLVDRGRVVGLRTASGTLEAETVVCATGPWTRRLVERYADLPTTILRNAMALFLRPTGFERDHAVLIDYGRRFYARPYPGGLSLTGSVDEAENQPVADPDDYDRGVHNDEVAAFGGRVTAAFPRMRPAVERGGWVGLYDVSPDWLHLIDELPGAGGLWILCGTSGHGFKLAPAVARITADLLLGKPCPEAEMFRLERLATRPSGFGVLA